MEQSVIPEASPSNDLVSEAATDRRDSYRCRIEPGAATVRIAGSAARVELRDLSGSGGCLLVHGPAPATDRDLPVVIELDNGEQFSAQLQIVRVRPKGEGVVELGARFSRMTDEAVSTLSSFLAQQHQRTSCDPARLLDDDSSLLVTSPVFISNLFSGQAQRSMQVLDGRDAFPAHLVLEGQQFEDGQRLIVARFVGDAAVLVPGHLYNFALSGPGAVTMFESTCVRQEGCKVFISTPAQVRQTGFRESPRIPLKSVAASMWAAHPRVAGHHLQAPLADVAGRGVAFPLAADAPPLFPGERLPFLRLVLPEGVTIRAVGVVRNVARRGERGPLFCGVELTEFASAEDADRWHRFVFQAGHPNLADGTGRAQDAWQVLESSKYIDQWTPARHRRRIRKQFDRAWSAPPSQVGHQLILQKDGSPVGVSAGSLAYPQTWILHHLGIAAEHAGRESMLHASELICGLLSRLRDAANMEHFVIYAELGKRWNDRLYGDFYKRYPAKDKLQMSPSRVYRRNLELPLPPPSPTPDNLRIVPATSALWDALADQLETTMPQAERMAYAFDRERIELHAFSKDCQAAGYERRRKGYFAMIDGRPVAALVAETGGEGVNVFGLLNTCQMFWLQPQTAQAGSVRELLLAAAVEHYRRARKKTFLLFDDQCEEEATRLGFEAISPALRWLAHRDVIPAWAAYLRELLSAGTPAKESRVRRPAPALEEQPVSAVSKN